MPLMVTVLVAPHAGAWIETRVYGNAYGHDASRPTRARGLKHIRPCDYREFVIVAPHAGAWIETHDLELLEYGARRRAPRGRVD